MIEWGISALSHDAALAVFVDGKLVFASHAERYSRIKNDKLLNAELLTDALVFGKPEVVYFYENPWLKKSRQLMAGQYNLLLKPGITKHLNSLGVFDFILHYTDHHESHVAGGYFSSGFDDAVIVCLDSIGEWETFSIWKGQEDSLDRIFSQNYPDSMGLWYSAITQRIGLKPNEHEYILMGMAALGNPEVFKQEMLSDFFEKIPTSTDPSFKLKHNLHRGCAWWKDEIKISEIYDIAAATQSIFEDAYEAILCYSKQYSKNLILTGGCALNCVANSIALEHFDNIWIMPNPGDAGSAIGAVLAHKRKQIEWPTAYLGHNIEGPYPTNDLLRELLTNQIVGVAAGRAEFGPRALGNRSLFADPRGPDIKEKVNKYKKRELFRPFAPVILEEYVDQFFDVPMGFTSPYMQFTATCKYPNEYPAIVHFDNTSRVQTVNEKDHPELYGLLRTWYIMTGCPMLLNTSLNIKDEPLVNTRADALRWEKENNLKVCLP